MDEDGRIPEASPQFYQINVHFTHRPDREQIFPIKGKRVILMVANEDELGNMSFDGKDCFHLTHGYVSSVAKMIDRLLRMYPEVRQKVRDLEQPKVFRHPGTAATN